jgi:spore coat protein H
MEEAGIMPLFYKYVELSINGETQGIYFLVEDPESWAEEQGSEYILRRDYNHSIIDFEYNPARYNLPEETYRERFRSIYSRLPEDTGKPLHAYLEERILLEAYFTKMGIDFFLQNGDYTDEIFFYSTVNSGQIQFRIIPWDYDDIFSRNPHEVGRSWGIGTLFGPRSYPSREAIYEEIGDHLVYSIEDDLDYVIARDPYLYARYEEVLADFFRQLKEADIESLFTEVETELAPFYGDPRLVEPSRYDRRPTSLETWEQNMAEKKSFLLERLDWIKAELALP